VANNTQVKLNRAIQLARAGDRARARRMLQEVVLEDRTSEAAWLWLASVSDDIDTKRKCLERVLQINPTNNTARDGLARIRAGAGAAAPRTLRNESFLAENATTLLIIGAAIIAAIAFVSIIVNAVRDSSLLSTGDLSPFEVSQGMTQTAAAIPTATDTQTPAPTPTPPIIIVTVDAATLPPTFTPTNTPTTTPTATPGPTEVPRSDYRLAYASLEDDAALPTLYSARGDGLVDTSLGVAARAYDVNPVTGQIAFFAEDATVSDDDGSNIGGIRIGTEGNLSEAPSIDLPEDVDVPVDVTALAWSADGERLAFIAEGREWLGIIDLETRAVITLLRNDSTTKRGVSWSADGTLLVFGSDLNSPGFTELYTISTEGGTPSQITDDIGSSYDPAFSPDGNLIAFVSDRGGDGDIYVADADGTDVRLLTPGDNGAEDQTPSWSSDGRFVAFASNRSGGGFQVYFANQEGTAFPVTTNDRTNRAPVFFP
jgi:hypothetical protein